MKFPIVCIIGDIKMRIVIIKRLGSVFAMTFIASSQAGIKYWDNPS